MVTASLTALASSTDLVSPGLVDSRFLEMFTKTCFAESFVNVYQDRLVSQIDFWKSFKTEGICIRDCLAKRTSAVVLPVFHSPVLHGGGRVQGKLSESLGVDCGRFLIRCNHCKCNPKLSPLCCLVKAILIYYSLLFTKRTSFIW